VFIIVCHGITQMLKRFLELSSLYIKHSQCGEKVRVLRRESTGAREILIIRPLWGSSVAKEMSDSSVGRALWDSWVGKALRDSLVGRAL